MNVNFSLLEYSDKPRVRRRVVKALGAAGLAAFLPGCDFIATKPVVVASHTWVGYEPMFLAQREGWLDERLVRLHQTATSSESIKALLDGRVEGAALTLDEVFKVRQDGCQLTAVMIFNISAGADVLVGKAGIETLADLRGKRIAYEQSSVGELLLSEILRIGGLARSDVQLVPLSVDQHVLAWLRGDLDSAVTYEPVASELLGLGARRLFDSRQIPNTIIDVLAMRTDILDSRAGAIRHLTESHFKALDHLTRNPHDAAFRMADHLKLPADDVLSAFKGLQFPDAASNYRLLAGDPPQLLGTARKLSAVMVRSELLRQDDGLQSLVRADFLPVGSQGRQ